MASDQKTSSSSDERQASPMPADKSVEQKTVLEQEIKEIIGNLDIQFDESVDEENTISAVTTCITDSSLVVTQPLDVFMSQPAESQSRTLRPVKVENISTGSAATTVVHQQAPPKMNVSHLKSATYTWAPDSRTHPLHQPGLQLDTQGIPIDGRPCHGMNDHLIYRTERNDSADVTTSETTLTTNESSSISCGPTTGQYVRNDSNRYQYLAPVLEESRENCRPDEVGSAQQRYEPSDCTTCNVPHQSGVGPTNYGQNDTEQHQPPNYRFPDQLPCPLQYHCLPGAEPSYGPHMNENVNRYNSTHLSYYPSKETSKTKTKCSVTDYLLSKSRSFFNRREESECSEVIPQLYSASIKNGIKSQRFTFRAVTGAQPAVLTPYESSAQYHQFSTGGQPQDRQVTNCTGHTYDPPYYAPCHCTDKILKKPRTKRMCGNNCGFEDDGVKTKAYYTDMGCGYVSQASVPEKVDIYCFDQLNTGYPSYIFTTQFCTNEFFRTSDHPPPLFADIAVQRTEKYATVFWAEIFGVANVFTAFTIAMILQTFKFFLQGIIRPIMIGFVQILSDYLIKPFLTLLYNGFTQPLSIFVYNVVASIRDVLQPIAKGLGYFFELIAVVLRAIRLVEVKNVTNITPCTPPAVKY